ncbi:uncharacterized protein LOC107794953 isoform X1 [Nicotiana tabacum]|uniref:Uncharacterized protein LOC107794953 isoform X1 n=1 Tax=Nicotiana tabacum TaxID=4097 RepID=A0A1S4A8M8_TOBAC|nr:troponin C, isoallergen Bla g 6.0301-like isoform X2 [Nicotiana tomentosiformis]XP_016472997.1 PREDICTED: uncharacterized protein LOC107794953 isoform X1 [Nicotiana tabacum]
MESSAILREWFDRVDSEKIGSVTAIQLKSAFAIGNLEFPISVVQQMIRMYDFDRNGTMSFEEFVELNKFLLKVQHVFSDLERGRGFLVPDDVYEALIKIGFQLDSPALYTVCEDDIFLLQLRYACGISRDTLVLIGTRMENSDLMTSYLFVSLYSLHGTFLIHLTQASKAE